MAASPPVPQAGLCRAALRLFESCLLYLSSEDIAAAETSGVSFIPASAAQVQRLAMQRKIFYRAGEPVLATRGGGFFETAGTLQKLIEEGRRQQRDLKEWIETAEEPAVAEDATSIPVEAPLELEVGETSPMLQPEPVMSNLDAPLATPAKADSKRSRQRRWRPEAAEPLSRLAIENESKTVQASEPATVALVPSGQPQPLHQPRPQGAAKVTTLVQERGKRWLVAGAVRRGRANKHWSTRQR